MEWRAKLMSSQTADQRTVTLLPRVTCPHCWEQFPPQHILWVSEHADLLGDFRLGPEQPQRFLPTRFTVTGEALDARGFPCHQLACPNCHLTVSRSLLEFEPFFLSIFGAPASGKSYYLAALTWELRKVLPLVFKVSFADADPVLNRQLNEYEEAVFGGSPDNQPVPLASLIRKTEEQGDLYDTVSFGNQTISFPRPFLFTLQPQPNHPNAAKASRLSRTVCLYDNAGESFQPGKDSVAAPVTRHMAQSRVLFFVYDPTQDARFQRLIGKYLPAPAGAVRTMRQEPILHEAIARIRRFAGLRQSDRHKRPLIVILTKYDLWWSVLGNERYPPPWVKVRSPTNPDETLYGLDREAIVRQSQRARAILLQTCPEIVTTAEGFAEEVLYVPVSAVGWKASIDQQTGLPVIKPAEAEPYWVTVPFLYGLSRSLPGLIPAVQRPA